ncbi:uncharacterized protein TNCV_2944911 [Trichonephila clavipes]|nr:uncharacterized protein TNCV_2944911 [Trichonephila clavipes]
MGELSNRVLLHFASVEDKIAKNYTIDAKSSMTAGNLLPPHFQNKSWSFLIINEDLINYGSGLPSAVTCQKSCHISRGCGIPVVKVSDHGRHVMSSSPVPLKTRRVGQRCTLNLSRAETFSRWCGVVVRRGGASSGFVHVT